MACQGVVSLLPRSSGSGRGNSGAGAGAYAAYRLPRGPPGFYLVIISGTAWVERYAHA